MKGQLQRIAALGRLVLLDGVKRHALIGLVLLALLGIVGGLLFFGFFPRDIGRASVDFVVSLIWMTGLLFLFFHAVQVIAWDEERRVIHTLLARPISRGEYVLGVFFGLVQLLLLLNLILGGIGWGILVAIKSQVAEQYFATFSHARFLLSLAGLCLLQFAILAVILLFSGMVRGSFTVLLMALSFYLICNGLPVVRDALTMHWGGAESNAGTRILLQGLTVLFPDFGRLDFKTLVTAKTMTLDLRRVVLDFALVAAYVVLALWGACAVYRRRDLK